MDLTYANAPLFPTFQQSAMTSFTYTKQKMGQKPYKKVYAYSNLFSELFWSLYWHVCHLRGSHSRVSVPLRSVASFINARPKTVLCASVGRDRRKEVCRLNVLFTRSTCKLYPSRSLKVSVSSRPMSRPLHDDSWETIGTSRWYTMSRVCVRQVDKSHSLYN